MDIKIVVKTIDDREYEVEVKEDDTILVVKKRIFEVSDVGVETQRLIFEGRVLMDGSTVVECGIADGTAIHLVVSRPPPLSTMSQQGSSVQVQDEDDEDDFSTIRNIVSSVTRDIDQLEEDDENLNLDNEDSMTLLHDITEQLNRLNELTNSGNLQDRSGIIKQLGLSLILLSSSVSGNDSAISVHMIPTSSGNRMDMPVIMRSSRGIPNPSGSVTNMSSLVGSLLQNALGTSGNVTNGNQTNSASNTVSTETTQNSRVTQNAQDNQNASAPMIPLLQMLSQFLQGQTNSNENNDENENNEEDDADNAFEEIGMMMTNPHVANQNALEFIGGYVNEDHFPLNDSVRVFSVLFEKLCVSDVLKLLSGDWTILERGKPSLYHKILQITENGTHLDNLIDDLVNFLQIVFDISFLSEDNQNRIKPECSILEMFHELRNHIAEIINLILTPVMPSRTNMFPFSSKLKDLTIELLVEFFHLLSINMEGGINDASLCLTEWFNHIFQSGHRTGSLLTSLIVSGMKEEHARRYPSQ